ncbi:MAG TPA: polyprenyl synthetase family protein, partial [Polyangia bacterium]
RAMYRCHMGQALDLSVGIGALPCDEVYRTVATSTMLKTGALMELAARLGGIAAEAPGPRINALARFGRRLGLGLQMLDDFGNLNAPPNDATDSKALEDLRNGRPTWPWAVAAQELDEPTFAHLQGSARALVGAADSDGTRARALAAQLRMAVGLKGRRQTTAYLQRAVRDLGAEVGDREELELLTTEIQRLEAAYG